MQTLPGPCPDYDQKRMVRPDSNGCARTHPELRHGCSSILHGYEAKRLDSAGQAAKCI